MGVQRTIAEVENLDYIQLAESIGVDTIINKKLITASHIFKFTRGTNVQSIKHLTGSDAEVLEFVARADCKASKLPIGKLDFPKNAVIGGIVRGGKGIIASGSTDIKPHDHVIVLAIGVDTVEIAEYFK
jgi:trk system potassium uptake protein TrkA